MDRLQRIEQHFGRPLDRFESLCCGPLSVTILGNLLTSDFELIDNTASVSPERQEDFRARVLGFVGVIALIDGAFVNELAVPIDDATVKALAQAFVSYAFAWLEAKGKSSKRDGAEWLAKLFALPDTRDAERQALIDEYDDSNDNEC